MCYDIYQIITKIVTYLTNNEHKLLYAEVSIIKDKLDSFNQ